MRRYLQRLREGPRSLRYQLLSRSLLVLAVLLLMIGFVQYVLMRSVIYQNQADMMHAQLRSLSMDFREIWMTGGGSGGTGGEAPVPGGRSRNRETAEAAEPLNRRPLLLLPDTSLAWINREGQLQALRGHSYAPPQLGTEAYLALMSAETRLPELYRLVDGPDGTKQLVVFRLIGSPAQPQGLMQLGVSAAPLQDVIMRQLMTFGVLSLLALAGGVALYLPLLRRTLTPLDNMVAAVQRTGAQTLNEKFPASQGQVEIDRLAQSFNGMLERLEHSFRAEVEAKEGMRRFIADASHELRTPLTSIHGFLEVLLRGHVSPAQLEAALRSMHGESGRMKKLIEDLLLLARLDRSPGLELQTVNLAALIAEVEPSLTVLAGDRQAVFQLQKELISACDPDKFKQVLLNLFHNAVQHTDPSTGSITVKLIRTHNEAELSVWDNGSGILPDALPYVFDRFYRSDVSRARKSGGSGLGLAISRSIVEAHGGMIAVESTPGEGSVFRVRLALVQ
ncbi:HAMP domain-containing histidine kinase [Paenibacillus sp. F411]|uniref:sensor histidine kinase n=1 Tax=Paenibacillus sp. F411 TaxID=2820239 RepID=UPI001AAEEDFE|nr:HAMP domain-containing sensor histidine kinase [Paenibacillus sp. F411]MBO2945318.1 HAMP domain-containing histidine kinase [Paenibacillus sp. F411]